MANIIDENGLQTKTLAEIKTEITDGLKLAYGDDINVDQDTPDGQAINIFSLAVKDVLDLLTQVYNSFSPENAIGRTLDQRVAINGIQRKGGTFTTCFFNLVVTQNVTLVGLDSNSHDAPPSGIHTIADDNGNQFYLAVSQSIATGTHSLQYVAVNSGKTLVTPSQNMKLVSIQAGVSSVNTPSSLNIVLGLDEETDSELRLRRAQSVSLASQGYLASLKAEIGNISGVTYYEVYENNQSGVVDTIPGHSIWAIIEGGSDSDIAYAIYTKRNAGCGMKGATHYDVTQPDGTLFRIYFDRTQLESLYVRFNAHSISGVTLDQDYIKTQLVALVGLDVNESINSNDIAALIRQIDPNCLASSIELSSDGSTWITSDAPPYKLSPSAKNYRLSLVTGNITITVV